MENSKHLMANPLRDVNENMDPEQGVREVGSGSTTDGSGISTVDNSRRGSDRPWEKKRVGFTGSGESSDQRTGRIGSRTLTPPSFSPRPGTPSHSGANTPTHKHSRSNSLDVVLEEEDDSRSHLPVVSPQLSQEIHDVFNQILPLPKPRPAMRRGGSKVAVSPAHVDEDDEDDDEEERERAYRKLRAQEAFERGKRLEQDERIWSEPNTRHASPDRLNLPLDGSQSHPIHTTNIPLMDMSSRNHLDDTTDDEESKPIPPSGRRWNKSTTQANNLVRAHTNAYGAFRTEPDGLRSGAVTPIEEQEAAQYYVPPPAQYRSGILSTLLKLYNQSGNPASHSRFPSVPQAGHSRNSLLGPDTYSATPTPQASSPASGTSTPIGGKSRYWYSPHRNRSAPSLTQLVGSSASLGTPVIAGLGEQVTKRLEEQGKRPSLGERAKSSSAMAALQRMSRPRLEEEIRIKIHIAEIISRQKYLMKLCSALMQYGAPTHRMEEYMTSSARVLEIDAQFLYIPGSMIMSFDDMATHTTEVKLVRVSQGLNLGKLHDTHDIYKGVVHDLIGVEEATQRLDQVIGRQVKHKPWSLVPVYGLAAVSVGPFAFGARFIDLPIAFVLGCILGLLQLIIAPKSDLYANVFEISAAVITSFLARAFGSISGGNLFCFSALAQSSIALILPGYIVLCASLELQSRSIVAGSVRMVYAIIYSLFLGYGITIGTAIYGIIDKNATSATSCHDPMGHHWFFVFVPIFTMCLIVINQSKWKQAPVMMIIAFAGYLVSYFSSRRFAGNTQVSSTLGALVIGVMANLYSRIGQLTEIWLLDLWKGRLRPVVKALRKRLSRLGRQPDSHNMAKVLEEGPFVRSNSKVESNLKRRTRNAGYGLAAAAMLPAIFVQVPSGLSVSGSLVTGIASANQIAGNATNGTTVVNSTTLALSTAGLNSIAFNVGYSVIQVAIGITVGLFLSVVIVYPFGKKRSGLFSF